MLHITFVKLAGTANPLVGGGRYAEAPPQGLHKEGETSVADLGPQWPNNLHSSTVSASNPKLWPEVQAMPLNRIAPDERSARGCSAGGATLAPFVSILLFSLRRRRAP